MAVAFPHQYEREDLRLVGVVSGLPDQREAVTKFEFQVRSALDYPALAGQRLRLSCYRCDWVVEPGQVWQLTVRLKRPHGFASWGAFDYERYLFRHRIVAQGYIRTPDQASLLSQEVRLGAGWRARLRQQLAGMASDSAGKHMILALVIGDKSQLEPALRDAFQVTGVAHLMAISGLHIGLVFAATLGLYRLISWPFIRWHTVIPRQSAALLPALMASICYAALAGFAVSTQRALVMLIIYCACQLAARPQSLLRILLLTVAMLLLLDVNSILDVGFWLSCGAVLVIALVAKGRGQVGLVRIQLALWLGMLPLTLLFFGRVSLISPIVNLVAVPLFCLLLIPATLLAALLLTLGQGWVATPILNLLMVVYDHIAQGLLWLAELNYAALPLASISLWQWCWFALTGVALKFGKRKSIPLLGLCLMLGLSARSVSLPKQQMQLTLLDVGQGLAMVVETAGGVLVYDTGPRYSTGFSTAKAVLMPYLRTQGYRRINTLVISHADADHIGGLQDVLDQLPVDEIYTSRVDRVSDAQLCQKGQHWAMGLTEFEFLGPDPQTPEGSNNHSCVLLIKHLGQRVLITGDIEKAVERDLLRRDPHALAADVMLIPHQGSKTSSIPDFIDAVAPSMALVAAGYLNHYGHPHDDVITRYRARDIDVRSTVDSGSIQLRFDLDGYRVSTFRTVKQRFWHYQKVSNQHR
ncbi:DNA internalization-related competence protein ComEC/Rec2 [Arenicella chitinivorans]|uniref:DNA internalization-related competence protein ComEC/Rec2 n=1 Tax=Arenicella chitinivorans TaxID=1329800 RepID=A0A918VQR7_9GAMM|nr:DNA internalization-related competence protein ComEC/Rec2 [Arenicella chitinivorans]